MNGGRVMVAVATVLGLSAATAAAAPGDIERATVADNPLAEPDDTTRYPSLFGTGRQLVFQSDATNLLPAGTDTNGFLDVYRRNLDTDTTTRESLTSASAQIAGFNSFGGFARPASVASTLFETAADAVPTDANGVGDIFLRSGGATTHMSVTTTGGNGNGTSTNGAISADGQLIAFESDADNLLGAGADTNGVRDVFVRHTLLNNTTRVSVTTPGNAQVLSPSRNPVPNQDATGINRRVAFESDANLVPPEDTNGVSDVYVRDTSSNVTFIASVGDGGQEGTAPSFAPALSGAGVRIAFLTTNQLEGGGQAGSLGAYVRDAQASQTTRADVTHDGSASAGVASSGLTVGDPDQPIAISADGNRVAFSSFEDSLVPNDTNGARDVFVRDLALNRTVRVNIPVSGVEPTLPSGEPSLSSDGSFVAFSSQDNGLVPGDGSSTASTYFDAFVAEVDFSRPQSTIGTPPPATTIAKQVAIGFGANKTGSDFQCRIDGGAFTPCASPWVTPAVGLGAHAVQIRAIDRFGNVEDTPAAASFTVQQPAAQDQPPPPPAFRRSFNLEPVSGSVFVTVPGGERVRLEDVIQIPSGSLVDTRRGRVRLFAAATRRGSRVVSSEFFDGLFRVVQLRDGITELQLRGGSFKGCTARRSQVSAAARKRKKVRRLWGKGKGRFRTRGKHAAALVRGTTWLVEDRCDGTLVAVRAGSVFVSDFAKRKRLVLRKGKRYLARPRGRR